ncbi:hypothetical protein K435DRAFT_469301 [Dendrothele bispora CBS 962.96]|uniref:Uncharacterized protein n=1 Tax=Dendrothele bispora (strain CBS 962.96) TaxID=1314807 RepID=A0A4S8L004_DENBC|nr:hypothetical protein K435DRAFT_469301 [Dendrothele bispora CBS 962.96]
MRVSGALIYLICTVSDCLLFPVILRSVLFLDPSPSVKTHILSRLSRVFPRSLLLTLLQVSAWSILL